MLVPVAPSGLGRFRSNGAGFGLNDSNLDLSTFGMSSYSTHLLLGGSNSNCGFGLNNLDS